ncbi:MAG TPA: site-specific integrase [Thermoanaerobaculia bacterium]|jgi:integrase|nr:site-specific integrase [Thermoanaerobaculia bacterium]
MSIQRRIGKNGKVSWRVRIRMKGHPIQTETFDRKTDAAQWAESVRAAIREGRRFPTSEARRHTLAELIDRYRQEKLPDYDEGEQRQRAAKLAWWRARLGDRYLSDLTPAAISDARSSLARMGPGEKPAAPATQNRYLAVLRHALNIAKNEWGWLEDNSAKKVRPKREPRGLVRYLSQEERERLLAACQESDDPRLYPIVLVALSTGARKSEVVRLRWRDIALDRRTAVLQKTKNGERRTLVLAGQVLDVLKEMACVRQIGSDLVFVGRRGIAAFPRKPWDAAVQAAGLEDFRFHDLRHTFASYLAMSGATLPELCEALGHKTLAMVKRYAHLSEAHTSGVVKRMAEKFLA